MMGVATLQTVGTMNEAHSIPSRVVPASGMRSALKGLICVLILASASAFTVPQRTNTLVSSRTSPLFVQSDNSDDNQDAIKNRYLATCIPGLAPVLAQELEILGASDIETSGNAAVIFEGPSELGLKSLLQLRTAHRLMELIASSEELVQSRDDVHEFIRQYTDVKNLLGDGKGGLLSISVSVVLNQKQRIPTDINHSHYTALTIKNALCDVVRDLRGDRPDVDVENADVPLVAVLRGITGDGAEISLYRCLHPPGSLHRRGYRGNGAMHRAAMKESMAAGLLLYSGWPQKCQEAKQSENDGKPLTLVDPMGGSGSLVLEAAMIAANVAPGLMRIKCGLPGHQVPPALRWKSGRGLMDTWKVLLQEATEDARSGMKWINDKDNIKMIVNDIHDGALEICDLSLREAGMTNTVELRPGDCQELKLEGKCFVVTNPPWGVRLTDDMEESWESLRTFIRSCPPGTESWVLSGNKDATKHLGLRRSQSMVLKTADQDLRWIQYMIHDKSKPPEDREEVKCDFPEDRPPKRVSAPKRYEDSSRQSAARRFDDASRQQPSSRTSSKGYPINDYENERKTRDSVYNDERQSRRKAYDDDKRKKVGSSQGGGYQTRYTKSTPKVSRPDKGENVPLTERERETKRNSWNL
jgi:putative N6-adenine-specific DNA methylase